VWLAGLLVGAACAGGAAATRASEISASSLSPDLGLDLSLMTRAPEGYYYHDVVVGTGDVVAERSRVTVAYRAILGNGTVVDSSTGLSFRVGARQVIRGWDLGVIGMRAGGARILVIPPELGYGSQDRGDVPANSILVFRVQLIRVQ
jgi:FKBP-type peptidyl-prolyl cis-trans isomerase